MVEVTRLTPRRMPGEMAVVRLPCATLVISARPHLSVDSTGELRVKYSIAPNGERAVRLLVVDDEEPIRRALGRYLRGRGYDVSTADSGFAAMELLEEKAFAVAVCDLRMPGMNGVELMRAMIAKDPDLAVIMLTASDLGSTATAALTGGAVDYLIKPIEFSQLDEALGRALHKRSLLVQQREVERIIREEVAQRTAELEQMSVGIIEALVNAMEAKDEYLRGHAHGVAALGAAIAAELRLPAETIEHIRLAGRLQDVGRIGVRESVLNKPGTLTEAELEHMRSHLRIGVEILAPLKHLGPVLSFIQDHHEHWDGGGYPRGLKGSEISIGGRVLAAADAFHALTSRRAYRESLDATRAIEYMESLCGTLVDPAVFAALQRVVARGDNLPFIGLSS